MINAEKVIEDKLLVADGECDEQPDDHKARVSCQLKSILDARLSKETEGKAEREACQSGKD